MNIEERREAAVLTDGHEVYQRRFFTPPEKGVEDRQARAGTDGAFWWEWEMDVGPCDADGMLVGTERGHCVGNPERSGEEALSDGAI